MRSWLKQGQLTGRGTLKANTEMKRQMSKSARMEEEKETAGKAHQRKIKGEVQKQQGDTDGEVKDCGVVWDTRVIN